MNNDINTRIEFNIYRDEEGLKGEIKDAFYSPLEKEIAFNFIREKIETLSDDDYISEDFGYAEIIIDFFSSNRKSGITTFNIKGLSLDDIESFVDAVSGTSKTFISNSLKSELELAFENLKVSITNPTILAHFVTEDESSHLYLIAKTPDEEIYYGFFENQFLKERQIAGIPWSNFSTDYTQKDFRPIQYLDFGVEIKQPILKHFFENDIVFQKNTIFIHYAKNKKYIEKVGKERLEKLNLSLGLRGLEILLELTKKVKPKKDISEEDIEYFNFMGLDVFINIIEFFPQLINHCYRSENKEHLFHSLTKSNNNQLIEFRNRLQSMATDKCIDELIEILNKLECSPFISEDKLENIDFDKELLILNPSAYNNIFKKYLTEKMIAPFRKK